MELSINNVTKQFKDKKAVNDISFSMGNGVYGLLGVNGAGKTTLMRMLCTLTTPDCGMITWDGKDIFKMGASYRQILGYLPQDFGYYPYLTIYDYMMYIASIKGIRPAVAKKRTKELLKQVGLSDQKKQKMRNLSGGMVRRVGIAQAMLNDPKILILDEPTAGLDPKGRDEILDQVAQLHEKTGMTVVLVSHSMEDVAKYVDRLIVMNQGEKMLDGTPQEVFRHYKELEAVGLAAPQVTYVMHDLKEKGFEVSADAATVEEAADEIMKCLKQTRKAEREVQA